MTEVYAVIRVQTALRKKDGTMYLTGTEDADLTALCHGAIQRELHEREAAKEPVRE